MKVVRRISVLFLVIFLLFLAGCGKKKEEIPATSASESVVQLPTATPTPTPAVVTPGTVDSSAKDAETDAPAAEEPTAKDGIDENGSYTSRDDVALYIHTYGHLPDNYITKKEAENLGWKSSEGNLWSVAPGMSIGGSRFGNYEGNLPDGDYKECDIDYEGGYRNAKRLVYSTDGRIYYTDDHYETFEQLY